MTLVLSRTRALTAGLVIALSPLSAAACAQSAPAPAASVEEGQLSLSATGEVRAAPDMAVVSAGVVTQGDTASAALRANAQAMQGVFAALDEAGIADADRQTRNLSVNPVYTNYERGREREITGYEARNTVSAIVRDLDGLGGVIDALVGAGANQLEGVRFAIEDRQEAEDEARLKAMTELQRLRRLYELAGGFETGRVVSLSEHGSAGGPQPLMVYAARMESDAPTPVAAGELTVSVTVNAVFAITGEVEGGER